MFVIIFVDAKHNIKIIHLIYLVFPQMIGWWTQADVRMDTLQFFDEEKIFADELLQTQ